MNYSQLRVLLYFKTEFSTCLLKVYFRVRLALHCVNVSSVFLSSGLGELETGLRIIFKGKIPE